MQAAKQEFQLASPVINVRPIRYSLSKIITIIAAITAISLLLFLLSYRWTTLFILLIFFHLFYLWVSNHPLFLFLFYSVQSSDSEQINKYAINDLSYPTAHGHDLTSGGRKSNHLFIAKVHLQKEGIKYFHFKEQLYRVHDGVAAPVNQSDILKLLCINDFREYLRSGLSGERMRTSLELFKVQSRLLKPTIADFIKKRVCEELELSLANMFILLVAWFVIGPSLLSLVLLAIDATIMTLIVLAQSGKVDRFSKKFAGFTQKKFLVQREGVNGRVAFIDILIQKGGAEDEYMTHFRCLLLGNFQVICKQGASREQSIKKPVREVGEVSQQRKSRFVIRPLSYIQKASLRGNEHLIVMQNHSISKFFAMWFRQWKYAEYSPVHRETMKKIVYLFGIGLVFLIVIHLLFVSVSSSPMDPYNKDQMLAIISCLFVVVGAVQLLFCISHHKHIKNLQSCNIQTFGVDLTRAGTVSNIAVNFSELLELQFQEILYKNLIFDPSNRPFQPGAGTLQNGRTYESLLAIILYLSMGYFDQEQNKSTFLRVIYQLFEDYFQYKETLDDTKIILHSSTNRMWRLIHKDPENEAGLRSWRILYENQLKYVLTQFNILSREQDFSKYVGSEDQNRMDIYASLAESLMEEGKKVRLLMFKSYKKDNVNLRDTEIVNHTEEQFMHVSRNKLEKNMEFAAFIVFDNALKAKNKKTIEFLRDLSNDDDRIFKLSVYSHSKNQNLAGFEHILESVPIHYSLKSHEKASMARDKMQSGGTVVVGTDIDDAYAQLVSDMSVRIVSALDGQNKVEKVILPADFCIQGVESLKELFSNGMEHAHFKIQALKHIFIVWFWVTLGWVVMISAGKDRIMPNSESWAIIILFILVFLPLLAKKILEAPQNMKKYKKCLQVFTFTYVSQLLLSFFIATVIVIFGFNDLCKAQARVEGQIHFRNTHNLQYETFYCTNLPLILSGSASVLSFTVFFGDENCFTGYFEWWRLVVPVAWFAMMFMATVPLKLLFLCMGVVLFLFGLKIMMRFVGPSAIEGSLKQSQNAETEIQ